MNKKKGKLIVISGPSGCGKSSVIGEIFTLRPSFDFSISATTRKPRPNETNGVEYIFMSKEEFNTKIHENWFIEYAEYVGEFYGTPVTPIQNSISEGKVIILDIEVVGAHQVMKKMQEAVSIFLVPPSMEELERRLKGRGTDSEEKLKSRLKRAEVEILEKIHYNHVVVNDDISRAANEIIDIIESV